MLTVHRNREAIVGEAPHMRWHQQIPTRLHGKILHCKCQQKQTKCCWTNSVQYTHCKWILVLKFCPLNCCNLEIVRKYGTAKVLLYVKLATWKSAKKCYPSFMQNIFSRISCIISLGFLSVITFANKNLEFSSKQES